MYPASAAQMFRTNSFGAWKIRSVLYEHDHIDDNMEFDSILSDSPLRLAILPFLVDSMATETELKK